MATLLDILGTQEEASAFLSKHRTWCDTTSPLAMGHHAHVWHELYTKFTEYAKHTGSSPSIEAWHNHFSAHLAEYLADHNTASNTASDPNDPNTVVKRRRRSRHPELVGLHGKEYMRAYMQLKRRGRVELERKLVSFGDLDKAIGALITDEVALERIRNCITLDAKLLEFYFAAKGVIREDDMVDAE